MSSEDTVKRILHDAGALDQTRKSGGRITAEEVGLLRQAFSGAVNAWDKNDYTKREKQCEALLKQLEEHTSQDTECETGDLDRKLKGKENWRFTNIPPRRRLQTLCVFLFNFFHGIMFSYFFTFVFIMIPWTMPFMVAYLIYTVAMPVKHPNTPKQWFIRHKFWEHYRDYFPIRLVIPKPIRRKFNPKKNYMFISHPHGVHSFGAMINFSTNANGIQEMLPGIKIHGQSLGLNFKIPFWRELFVWGGTGDASASTIRRTLGSGPGKSIMLVVGGAEESLLASPHTSDLTLSKRKGFVKIALTTGSPLVPVFHFGENNVYGNLAANRPWLQRLLKKMQKKMGFAMPMISGRGIFNYNFGLMPHRRPIVTVIGEPLEVPKIEKPTQEEIDKWHRLYVDALVKLYKENKSVYDIIGQPVKIH